MSITLKTTREKRLATAAKLIAAVAVATQGQGSKAEKQMLAEASTAAFDEVAALGDNIESIARSLRIIAVCALAKVPHDEQEAILKAAGVCQS